METDFKKYWSEDTRFIDLVRKFYGEDIATTIDRFFDTMLLPLPQEKEYIVSTDEDGLQVFLPQNISFRIVNNDIFPRPLAPHPRDLTLIGMVSFGHMRLEIRPGIDTANVTESDMIQIKEDYEMANRHFWDADESNIGTLPHVIDGIRQEKYVVNLDSGAVEDLNSSVAEAQKYLDLAKLANPALTHNPQNKIYKRLQNAFDAIGILPSGRCANPQKVRDFWNICHVQKQRGVLVDGWNRVSGIDRTIHHLDHTKNYAQSVTRHQQKLGF